MIGAFFLPKIWYVVYRRYFTSNKTSLHHNSLKTSVNCSPHNVFRIFLVLPIKTRWEMYSADSELRPAKRSVVVDNLVYDYEVPDIRIVVRVVLKELYSACLRPVQDSYHTCWFGLGLGKISIRKRVSIPEQVSTICSYVCNMKYWQGFW